MRLDPGARWAYRDPEGRILVGRKTLWSPCSRTVRRRSPRSMQPCWPDRLFPPRPHVLPDVGVFTALLEGLIAEATRHGQTDLSLVRVDSTTARAHHDAAGIRIGKGPWMPLRKPLQSRSRPGNKRGAYCCGSVCPSAVPTRGLTRSRQTRPTRPAVTAPTCADQGGHPGEDRTKPPAGRRRATGAADLLLPLRGWTAQDREGAGRQLPAAVSLGVATARESRASRRERHCVRGRFVHSGRRKPCLRP